MIKTGVFISDLHMPHHIKLTGIFEYIKLNQPDWIIFGGDIIDADGLHASESMKAEQVKMSWFHRDVKGVTTLVNGLKKLAPSAKVVFLAGNHEERYERLRAKYPDVFGETLDFAKAVSPFVDVYIPYAQDKSYYKIGDCVFVHGDVFPANHAKQYADRYAPLKVVYGHLHHLGAYSGHRALVHESPRYSMTAGHLSTQNPAWKKGQANQWVNGFVTFWTDGRTTVPTAVIIEKGKFVIGGHVYQ